MRFGEYTESEQVRVYLNSVLSRTGSTAKNNKYLYHYTKIDKVLSIVKNSSFWLGSASGMNDYFESQMIKSFGNNKQMFFSSFSKSEENIALYKMYAPNPDGVMIKLSYSDAAKIIGDDSYKDNVKEVFLVRDNKITKEKVTVELYWSEVCYKELHNNTIKAGTKANNRINNPLESPELMGLIKMDGWEYEQEVRLVGILKNIHISEKERLNIIIPNDVISEITIIKTPEFDTKKNKSKIAELKKKGIIIEESFYDTMVDLGEKSEANEQSGSIDKDEKNTIIEWIQDLHKTSMMVSELLDKALQKDNPNDRYELYNNSFTKSSNDFMKDYICKKPYMFGLIEKIDVGIIISQSIHNTISHYVNEIHRVGGEYLSKPITVGAINEIQKIDKDTMDAFDGIVKRIMNAS